jgi:hypothetical protein
MMAIPGRRGRRAKRSGRVGRPAPALGAAVLTAALTAGLMTGCDHPFEPFAENTVGPFSVFGYLDLKADTQWVRVMPIRHHLLPDSGGIDAVVTLEHLGSGRVVTLRDSLFTFVDPRLGAVGYAHNFWTTEPMEPGERYRLRAVRSDGAETTALVDMPPELIVTLRYWEMPDRRGVWEPRRMFLHAEHPLYVDLMYTVWDEILERGVPPFRVRLDPRATDPGRWEYGLPGVGPFQLLNAPPYMDMLRREVRIAVAGADWPYQLGLPDTDLYIPDRLPSTVEDGVGSLVGVGTWAIPLPLCTPMEPRPAGGEACTTVLDARSASVMGRVTLDPCGAPMPLPAVRLTERYPGGGAVVWEWRTDWDGRYHFEGLEPGAELSLEVEGHPAGAIHIPPLSPGARFTAPHLTFPNSCGPGSATPDPASQDPV